MQILPEKLYLAKQVRELDRIAIEQYGIAGLEDLFEKTYYSYTTGLRKPYREIFELVLHENGLVPAETLFIDDSKEHLAAAEKLGIVTRWMERNGEL
jgi:putative hydrolase of the HAD superfamily